MAECLGIQSSRVSKAWWWKSCHYRATDEAPSSRHATCETRSNCRTRSWSASGFETNADVCDVELSTLRRRNRSARDHGRVVHHVVSSVRAAVAVRALESRARRRAAPEASRADAGEAASGTCLVAENELQCRRQPPRPVGFAMLVSLCLHVSQRPAREALRA